MNDLKSVYIKFSLRNPAKYIQIVFNAFDKNGIVSSDILNEYILISNKLI